jgi:hypothetical protein
MKLKISFDYDGVFSSVRYRNLAKWYLQQGFDVYITTARFKTDKENNKFYPGFDFTPNSIIFEQAKQVGIPKNNIRFCGHTAKAKFLENFQMHYDDQNAQIHAIDASNINCLTILVTPEH